MTLEIPDGGMTVGNTTSQNAIVLWNLHVVVMTILERFPEEELTEEEFFGEFRKLWEAWELQNPES